MIFFLLCSFYFIFSFDSPELKRSINRESAIVTSAFLLVSFILIKIYGGIDIGKRTSKEIILSVFISTAITDVFTFVQLCIMEKKIIDLFLFIPVLFIQFLIIAAITVSLTRFFFCINPAKKLLILYDSERKLDNIIEKLGMIKNRFIPDAVHRYDEDGLYGKIKKYNDILLVDVPSEAQECIIEYCYKSGKNVLFTPCITDIAVSQSKYMMLDDISLFSFRKKTLSAEQKIIKRTFDIIISLFGIVFTFPAVLITSLLIKLSDGGHIFYKQKRITENGKIFTLLKFRTMIENAESSGAVLAEKHDKRITPIGLFLRKTRLDEIPQLLNILRGDMSLVGPRPERPDIAKMYEADMPEFSYRLNVRAGLTGLAQVNGKYDTSPSDKLMLDLLYIENYSLRLDIKILFRTAIVCLSPEKAN